MEGVGVGSWVAEGGEEKGAWHRVGREIGAGERRYGFLERWMGSRRYAGW